MPDILLTFGLVVLVPAYQLWRSLRRKPSVGPPRRVRNYLRTLGMAAILLTALALVWIPAGRSWAALGFALPMAGQTGLALAAAILTGFLLYVRLAKPSGRPPPPEIVAMMPSGAGETAAFLATTIVIGAAWEVLYRGYLLWSLAPAIGTWPAVMVASAAYGAAHGYKSPGQFIGSLVAALAFTSAFALTHSLWWLILIHAGLPLLGILGLRREPAPAALA